MAEGVGNMNRRYFIKGMAALALIPLIPTVRPERKIDPTLFKPSGDRYMRIYYETTTPETGITAYIQGSEDGIKWDNTGTLITPIDGTRWKVDYKVIDGETEIIDMKEIGEGM